MTTKRMSASLNIKGGGMAHVGLPKTASTFLQKHYFPQISSHFWSTQPPFSWPPELNFVFHGNALWYGDLLKGGKQSSLPERRNRYASLTRSRIAGWRSAAHSFARSRQGSNHWFLSAEGLCGLSQDICALHMALMKEAGVAKVFFVCRQQAGWAKSLWLQFLLAEDRFARFVSFETLFGSSEHEGVVDPDWTHYVQVMDAEFGTQNVLVLPYELLLTDSQMFFRRLNAFLGIPSDALLPDVQQRENVSRNDSVYQGLVVDDWFLFDRMPRLRYRLHRLAKRYHQLIPAYLWHEYPMSVSEEALAAWQRRFVSSNVLLEARIGLDLKAYGYY
jgi:hypothetical protein